MDGRALFQFLRAVRRAPRGGRGVAGVAVDAAGGGRAGRGSAVFQCSRLALFEAPAARRQAGLNSAGACHRVSPRLSGSGARGARLSARKRASGRRGVYQYAQPALVVSLPRRQGVSLLHVVARGGGAGCVANDRARVFVQGGCFFRRGGPGLAAVFRRRADRRCHHFPAGGGPSYKLAVQFPGVFLPPLPCNARNRFGTSPSRRRTWARGMWSGFIGFGMNNAATSGPRIFKRDFPLR